MAWDDDKSKGSDLPSDEWNEHVEDQKNHSSRHESGGSDVISVAVDQITSFASNVISSISGEDIEPNSVSAQSLYADTLNNRPATVTWGDSGDLVPVGTLQIAPNQDLSTTSDVYTNLASGTDIAMFDAGFFDDIANLGKFYIMFVCQMRSNDDTATAYARINSYRDGGLGGTEVQRTHTSIGFASSNWAEYNPRQSDRLNIEGKVETGGTLDIRTITVYIAREVQ